MNKILEMRNKRAEAWESAKKFLDEKRDERGLLSAEDAAAYEKMEQEIDDMGRMIDRLERAEALEKEMNAPANKAVVHRPGEGEKQGRASEAYNKAFWDMMRTDRSMLDRSVLNSLQISTDSKGGYLAPDEFEKTLIKKLEEQNVMRSLATVIKTEHGELQIPVLASGGEAAWTGEEQPYHESDMEFDQITLNAYKLTRIMKVSEELVNDSVFDLAGLISDDFARAFGVAEEEAFLTGDGEGKPMGLLDDTYGVTEGITAASATAVTFDEMFDLYYSLRAPYRSKAVWLMNDMSVKLLRKLKDGNQQYIWQPAVTAGAPDMILGRPVYTSPFMPAAAAGGKAIVFGDLKYYWIADRQARNFRRLDELYATTGQVGFLGRERVDGRLILPEAVKVLTMGA